MWTSSGLRVWIVWAIKLGKDGYVYGGSRLENLSTQIEEGDSYLPAEDGHRGVHFTGEVGRPGWLRAAPWLSFFSAWWSLLRDHCARVLHLLHHPNALVHSFACIIGPSTWCSWFESCPYSLSPLASHAPLISCKVMLVAHPCLSFARGLDESCWKGIQWCIMVHAWLT
jgi:hypothetical protein